MAKNLSDATPDDAPAGNRQHNMKARGDAIRKLHRELLPLEDQAAKLNEEMKELRQTFKADTGIGIGDFKAIRRIIMIEDDDERGTVVDNMKEIYAALTEGEQLDWVAATADDQAAAE